LCRSTRTVSAPARAAAIAAAVPAGPSAGDQHVAVAEHRHPSRPLDDGVTRAWPTLDKPAGAENLGLKKHAAVIG